MITINKTNIFGDINTPEVHKATAQFFDFKKDHDNEIVASAIMPDAHFGYSVPIGSVFASKTMVFPCAVGYDIGCGMCAVPTTYSKKDIVENTYDIWQGINAVIPVGFNHHNHSCDWDDYNFIPKTRIAEDIMKFKNGTGWRQLGTLGGGNHFIEIGYDENDKVWVVIHSGSRGIGHAIATQYMRIAGGGKAREGFYGLNVDSDDGKDYIKDLAFGLEYALENRKRMMYSIESMMSEFVEGSFSWSNFINRNHNHAELKNHPIHGDVWIHRKGATHAEKGMMGVIPGNMRDGSFIVKGKGNIDSLYSSSHGAGRVLGRKKAKEILKLEDFENTMEGIVANVDAARLDESPFAYKNIFKIMKEQEDLVEVVAHVKPILNVKG